MYSNSKGVLMTNTKQYLGIRIQELRKKKQLKQTELAEIIGIDSKHMSKLECGRSYPSFDLLDKIAQALDVSPDMLLSIDHLKDKNSLISEIDELLEKSEEAQVRKAYKIIKEFL